MIQPADDQQPEAPGDMAPKPATANSRHTPQPLLTIDGEHARLVRYR
jgi:hypothetical protein